jgi:hypoxanthine phosphoribosyltransferase
MEVLIGTADIHRRIGELGKQIARDHPRGTPLLVGVLNGCIFFVADLMRAIPIPHEVDFVSVTSYGASSQSSRAPRLVKDLEREIGGRDVILVEDIVDSGHTLSFLRDTLLARGPRSLKIATLLDKRERRDARCRYHAASRFPIASRGLRPRFRQRFGTSYIAAIQPMGRYRSRPEAARYAGTNRRGILIGIAGARGQARPSSRVHLGEHPRQDSYYKDLRNIPLGERESRNFDHPDAFDGDLLRSHLETLLAGGEAEVPIYDMRTHTRNPQPLKVKGRRIIILDGILILDDHAIRQLMDIKLYVDADPDIRFIRRLKRDLTERGRTLDR